MTHDVYSFGVISASTLYLIGDAFPDAEGYAEIKDTYFMTGGEAANSSVVLARLGVSVKLDGNCLGDNDAGQRTWQLLNETGVQPAEQLRQKDNPGVEEVVFAAPGTRTIFGSYVRQQETQNWEWPSDSDIATAKLVNVDPFFGEASLAAAKAGRKAGNPVVTVDARHDNPLLEHVTVAVIAESFLREHYADQDLESVFADYQSAIDGLTIFTFGERETWYARQGEERKPFPSFTIDAIDTVGGGDSFRAGVVYGILQGWDDDGIIEFAAGLAALVCSRFPGVLTSPSLDEVAGFIESKQ